MRHLCVKDTRASARESGDAAEILRAASAKFAPDHTTGWKTATSWALYVWRPFRMCDEDVSFLPKALLRQV